VPQVYKRNCSNRNKPDGIRKNARPNRAAGRTLRKFAFLALKNETNVIAVWKYSLPVSRTVAWFYSKD